MEDTPPGTPFRHPHSEQRWPARAHAVVPVLGPHARIDRTRDTRVAEPWLPAPDDGRPGEGQRLTPGAPHNGGRHPPPGDALPPPPQRATPAREGARWGAGAGFTRPYPPHPGHTGCGALAARSRGRAAGGGTAPDTRRPSQRWKTPPPGTPFRHPHREQRQPARAHTVGPVLSPHARIDRTRDTRDAEFWLPAPEDGRPGEGQRLTPCAPHNGGNHPPPGTPLRHPRSEQRRPARAHAAGPVLGLRTRTDRTRDTRDAEPWLPAPEDGRPGEGQRLTPGAPRNGGKHPPPGDALPPPPQRATPARKGASCGAGAGSTRPHGPHPGHPGRGTLADRSRGRMAGGGTAPDTRRPSQWWKAPPGDAIPPPPRRATPARKGARRGAGAGSPRPHRPHPGHTGRGALAARSSGRAAGGGTAPDTRRPSH